jgi:class 3 adenylate cyclase/tetratricopeptide (TPR) repeat protein
VRVGIATGLVVVGDLLGEGEARERGVVGATPNLAARLQALAEPGTVVIAPGTRRLIGGLFDYEDLGAVEIKGLAVPVVASRVLRESRAESRFEALRATRTPLVGRDEELALLQRRWQQAKSSEGSVALVTGEPGIGKSRLAETLIERLAGEPHTRLRFFCSPHHQDHALYPTIAQLERAAGFRREDTADERLDKLGAVLARATNDLGEAVPLLAALLSLPAGERYPPLSLPPERPVGPAVRGPQKQKQLTLQALVAQVEGLAARHPLLILFEDAQWSDPTSLELLDLIVDRVSALPVLLIVTYRPEFSAPWAGRPHVATLSLSRLAPRQRAEMIAGVTGDKALPQEIAAQIIDRTDGVPLFVEELTKAVVESGILTDAGDHYTAVGPLPERAIPASLQASLLARLDRLAPVREVAQIGAALGRQFSHELIVAVAVSGSDRSDPGMPPAALDAGLVQLVGAELIYRRGTPPDAEYTFKHALIQDAAYGTLLRERRRQLHGRIAATLEDRFPEMVAAQPALLAHHCTEAGLTEKAVDYWLAGGRQAWGRSAVAEAVALLRRGLALAPALPDGDRHRETEFDMRIALGQALIATRGWAAPEVGEAYARARQLAPTLKRPRALLSALLGQYTYHANAADFQQARQLAAEMEALGETSGDNATQVIACLSYAHTCHNFGEFTAARAYAERGLALYDPASRQFYAGLLPRDMLEGLLVRSALPLACLGHLDQARARADAALTEARRLSHPFTLADALAWNFWTGWCCRTDPKTLLQCADEMNALTVEHELTLYRFVSVFFRGWCLAALGHADDGIPLLNTGLADTLGTGFRAVTATHLTMLAEACRTAGQWQIALEHLSEAHRFAETGDRWAVAETLRLRGDVLLATGDATGAEASYREAIAIAQRQGGKLWELRAATSLAGLWRDQGKSSEVRDLLAPVYGWFTEGFDTPVPQEAQALLEELAA